MNGILTRSAGLFVLLASSATSPVAGEMVQEPVPPPASPQFDSIRVQFERLSREQAEEIQRIIDARRSEFEEIRIQLLREAEEVRRQLDSGRLGSEVARRQFLEAQQRLVAGQEVLESARRELEAAREAVSASLSEALDLRQGELRGLLSPSGTRDGTRPLIYIDGVEVLPGSTPSGARVTGTTPLLAGQRMVAGLELTELNPSLARYFGVESGVLITEVIERTPGAEAGLLPGDVLVQVGGEPVGSVEEVRGHFRTLAPRPPAGGAPAGAGGVPVRIIREGAALELVVPR